MKDFGSDCSHQLFSLFWFSGEELSSPVIPMGCGTSPVLASVSVCTGLSPRPWLGVSLFTSGCAPLVRTPQTVCGLLPYGRWQGNMSRSLPGATFRLRLAAASTKRFCFLLFQLPKALFCGFGTVRVPDCGFPPAQTSSDRCVCCAVQRHLFVLLKLFNGGHGIVHQVAGFSQPKQRR